MNHYIKQVIRGVTTVLVTGTLWHIITIYTNIHPLFLPELLDLGKNLKDLYSSEGFSGDIRMSNQRVRIASVMSILTGTVVAIFIHQYQIVRIRVLPMIDFLRYIPVPALIPLSILFFGIGEEAKIRLLYMGTVLQFILLVLDSLENIPLRYIRISKTLGYTSREIIRMKTSSILPQIYDHSRIIIGFCRTYVTIVELVAAGKGMGYVLKEAQRFADSAEIYAVIISMGIIGLITDQSLKAGKNYLFPHIIKK